MAVEGLLKRMIDERWARNTEAIARIILSILIFYRKYKYYPTNVFPRH